MTKKNAYTGSQYKSNYYCFCSYGTKAAGSVTSLVRPDKR